MGWTVALCGCNGTLSWDADRVQRALSLEARPPVYQRLRRDEIHALIDQLGVGRHRRLLVACCGEPRQFHDAAAAAGLEPVDVAVVDPRPQAFWVHRDREAANGKAIRLLRAAMAGVDAVTARPPGVPVRVDRSVLIFTDSPAGVDLARRLVDVADPRLVLDEESPAFDDEPWAALPWPTTRGAITAIEGTLGRFQVTVRQRQPLDLGQCVGCRRCVPVCHTAAITDGLRLRLERCDWCGDCLDACGDVGAIRIPRDEQEVLHVGQVAVVTGTVTHPGPRRTGHHVLAGSDAGAVDGLAWRIAGLIGEFRKPRYVAYDAGTCAGGASGRQACGRCIAACPYDAITRAAQDVLRVSVDHPACEGCGACVAVCPTSSLTFTEPPADELDARLRALLRPVNGGSGDAVVAFHCPEQGAQALAEAGRRQSSYPASIVPVSMACLRHVSVADILRAFAFGAAGVALLGCPACPHGERAVVGETLATAEALLRPFGLGERLTLVPADGPHAMAALGRFAETLAPSLVRFPDDAEGEVTARRAATLGPAHASPVPWAGPVASVDVAAGAREVIADAIRRLISATGREPGRVPVPPGAAMAFPDVHVTGCTLCRTCVNVCPTHAFRFDDAGPALTLRQVACVNCGLCAGACPESVITLRPETFLTRAALEHRVVVQDEAVRCTRCGTVFGTRRAVDAIEARILAVAGLGDTFAGSRRRLLRMCPSCRASAAVLELQQGWEP